MAYMPDIIPPEERARYAKGNMGKRVGFGTAAALRDQFVRRRGVPPREYRRAFRSAECPEEEGAA